MSVDPGGTTGFAYGVFKPHVDDSMRTLLARSRSGIEAGECYGPSEEQAWDLFLMWRDFRSSCDHRCVLIIEDFALRQRSAELSPIEVTYGLLTLLRGEDGEWRHGAPVKQMPSTKSYATNDRLKDWGVWIIGSEHSRDAVRHLCAYLSKALG